MSKERLKDPGISLEMMVQKMTNGHPGSIVLLAKIINEGGQIDQDDAFIGLGTILLMDMFGIHDNKPYYLYHDVCGNDLVKTIGMVRACQLGIISEKVLLHAIDNHGEGLDVEEIMIKVKETLPNFDNPKKQSLHEMVAALKEMLNDDPDTYPDKTIGELIDNSIKGTFLDPSTYEREVELTIEKTTSDDEVLKSNK